ncbi:hypothetical protein C6P45_002806 [Maudiozyma exigua]|uniref:Fibronectin type-III domain-containing protein n=1 Tax=Maudiozyma exigua TaxID=34358 RepID=A0A9P6VVD5_MAUEX|nr:hypothetical protein C6P45_002806 [Kazachstania exigua]
MAIPMYKIITDLNIRTPPAIKASIDKISHDSITVHWENEPLDKKTTCHISHFVIYLNNIQLATFPNDPNSLYTCCLIKGLDPHREYQLDFITINEMGFINKLPSLYCMTRNNNTNSNNANNSITTINNNTTNNNNNNNNNVNNSNSYEIKLDDSNDSLEQNIDLITPQIPGDDLIGSPTTTKTRKWRRNTVSSINQIDINSDYITSTDIPSYTNLTKLQDLDDFTIDDLKKILICAQEDLHEVLSQQATAIEDFHENRINLELELENLKSQWSHENDFRKSIKSNIKSLENAKLLSDMKFDKTNQKIESIKSKIEKMNDDISKWEKSEADMLSADKLKEKYDDLIEKSKDEYKLASLEIEFLQKNVSELEKLNKDLNSMKKTSSATNLLDHSNANANNQQNGKPVDPNEQTIKLLKKISECASDKTGALNSSGEYYLSKLNQHSPVARAVKYELRIDQEFEQRWKTRKLKLIKRIKYLENRFMKASSESRRLKENLFAKTYQQPLDSPSEYIPVVPTASYTSSAINGTQSNSDLQTMPSNDTSNTASNYVSNVSSRGMNPLLSAFDVGTPSEPTNARTSPDVIDSDEVNMVTISPSMNRSPFVNPPQNSLPKSITESNDMLHGFSSFSRGTATTATTDTIAAPTFPWGSSEQSQLGQSDNSPINRSYDNNEKIENVNNNANVGNGFGYNDTNHLITGLENMIYDENENADKVSNYSKVYTNDQLDNYWTTQKDTSNGSIVPLRNNAGVGNISGNSTGLAINNNDISPGMGHAIPAFANDANIPVSSSPLASHPFAIISHTPNNSVSLLQPQSLLAATLNDPSTMSPFQDNNLTMSQSESAFRNTLNNNGSAIDSFLSSTQHPLSPRNSQALSGANPEVEMLNFSQPNPQQFTPHMLSGTSNISPLEHNLGPLAPVNENIALNDTTSQAKNNHDSLFHSPSFNFIWQTTKSPSKNDDKQNIGVLNLLSSPTKPEVKKDHISVSSPTKSKRTDSNQTHKRNKSAGSASSWSNRLSLKSRQSVTSTVVEDNGSEDENSINSGASNIAQPSGKKTGSGSSGRRLTRLLSKSGMNNLFNLPGHDSQQSTSTST